MIEVIPADRDTVRVLSRLGSSAWRTQDSPAQRFREKLEQ
jgi:hypothetical protein